jgi:hypothetical protein
VCEVTKAAREILLKAMGEGLVAPSAAAAVVILDVETVHKSLVATLTKLVPPTVLPSEEAGIEGLSISAKSTHPADAAVIDYVSQMTAHLVVYDTLPTPPLNGVNEDAWKYALASTETGQWKGELKARTVKHLFFLIEYHVNVPILPLSRLCRSIHGSI